MKGMKVNASPTREYIINSITKEIKIEAAIFDLIDNSINAAEIAANPKKLEEYYVSLKINKLEFEISDNCGGIPKDKALGDAFRIGSSLEYTGGNGIGLKRAFLKFGRNIEITSNREDYSCKVDIDINKWGRRNNWNIDIENVEFIRELPQGFTIGVSELYDDIVIKFSDSKFINRLIEDIAMRYRYKLKAGFKIIINGQEIEALTVRGDVVEEAYYRVNDGITIKVILYNNIIGKNNGWDIIINGRVVVERDKSDRTLWRKRLIRQGSSYEKFVGEVLIETDNIKSLSIWSVKDGLDTNSKGYENILSVMYSVVDKNRDKFKKAQTYIQYIKQSDQIDILKAYFEVTTAKEVGERSFDRMLNIVNEK
jgi:hypothetical protein